MKKKIISYILMALLIIALGVGLGFAIHDMSGKEEYLDYPEEEKMVLVEKSYSNYAWGVSYNGSVIFNDGTIYTWDFSGDLTSLTEYDFDTADGLKKFVLAQGKKSKKQVTKEEIEDIKSYIHDVEDTIERMCSGADMGTESIEVWKSNNENISLYESGDCNGESSDINAIRIREIVNKYL